MMDQMAGCTICARNEHSCVINHSIGLLGWHNGQAEHDTSRLGSVEGVCGAHAPYVKRRQLRSLTTRHKVRAGPVVRSLLQLQSIKLNVPCYPFN